MARIGHFTAIFLVLASVGVVPTSAQATDPSNAPLLSKPEPEPAAADLAQLELARFEVARNGYKISREAYPLGRFVEPSRLFVWSLRLLESERALRPTWEDQMAAVESHWERTKEMEMIEIDYTKAQRTRTPSLLESRFLRLEAESWVVKARALQGNQSTRIGETISSPVSNDPLGTKELAKAKFELGNATFQDVANAQVEVAQAARDNARSAYWSGHSNLDSFLDCSVLLAEVAANGHQVGLDRTIAEKRWDLAWFIERYQKEHYDAGQIGIGGFLDSKYRLLEATVELANSRSQEEKEPPVRITQANVTSSSFNILWRNAFRATRREGFALVPVELPPDDPFRAAPVIESRRTWRIVPDSASVSAQPPSADFLTNPLNAKDLARDRFESRRIPVEDLAQERVRVARALYLAHEEQAAVRRVPPDIALELAQRVMEAELAIPGGTPEEVASRRKLWERAKVVEETQRHLSELGAGMLLDYLEAKYARLDAAIRFARAKANARRPASPGENRQSSR
jgi:hypothetical protein